MTLYLYCNIPSDLHSLSYDDKKYQSYVIANLENSKPSDYRYLFVTFLKEGEQTLMLTNFRNDKTCFDVMVSIDDWSMLEGMKRTNGKSYPKELRNLRWEIIDDIYIKYVGMDRIFD